MNPAENPVQVVQTALACAARLWADAAESDYAGSLARAAPELAAQFAVRGHRVLLVEDHVRMLGEIFGLMAWSGGHEGLIEATLGYSAACTLSRYERASTPELRVVGPAHEVGLSASWCQRVAEFGLPADASCRVEAVLGASEVARREPSFMVAGHYRTMLTELLAMPEVMDGGSVAARVVRFVASGQTPGFQVLVVRVPRSTSMAVLDRWPTPGGALRANCWMFLERGGDLAVLRETLFNRRLAPFIQHVELVLPTVST